MDDVRIQVRFEAETARGKLTDALYFAPDVWETMTEAELDVLKQARIDQWVNRAEEVAARELTREEYEAERAAIDQQIADLTTRKTVIDEELAGTR